MNLCECCKNISAELDFSDVEKPIGLAHNLLCMLCANLYKEAIDNCDLKAVLSEWITEDAYLRL